MQIQTAIIVCIGDELLIGQIIDTNSIWIAQELEKIGIKVKEKYVISDQKDTIVTAAKKASENADLIIFTGGLGPTKDDVTKFALNTYFGGQLMRNQLVYEHVQHFFKIRERPMLTVNEAQADVPDNCTILFNRVGTAPGMLFEREKVWVASMPGVPTEMKNICTEELFPRIQAVNTNQQKLIHKHLLLFGRGESYIADDIKDIEAALPDHIQLAYLPNYSILRLRLSGTGANSFQLGQEMEIYMSLIKERLSEYVVSDINETLATNLVSRLTNHRMTISTTESCTGGLIASKVTEVSGSSAVYMGSIISYDNDIKMRVLEVTEDTLKTVGAVSEAAVSQMAQKGRAIMKTDLCIAVSGILGPRGATPEKPVGTVWFALDSDSGTFTHQQHFSYDRIGNKEAVANTALFLLIKALKKKDKE